MAFNYDLTRITDKGQLLTFLGLEEQFFDHVIGFDPDEYQRAVASSNLESLLSFPFRQHLIPKRDPKKGKRVVWEAVSLFDREYKATSRRLEAFFSYAESRYPHPNAYGYVKGRNIRQNAQRHLDRRQILKCDIRDFFGSIEIGSVQELFEAYGVRREISILLAQYLTIGGHLPLGLPTSPIMTNMLCLELDDDMTTLSANYGAEYTRYADDMTFSSNENLPPLEDITAIVGSHGFALAHDKTRKTLLGQSHYVTGLSVSDPKAPHAPRRMKQTLRQQLYYAKKFGLGDHLMKVGIDSADEQQWAINSMDGMVKYVSHHEPKMANRLHTLWANILEENDEKPSFKPKNRLQSAVNIFGDETEFEFEGKTYLALGLCVTQHYDRIAISASTTLRNHLADPLADGDLERIKKNGLHFSDATEDLRKKFVSNMQKLPFTGYVAVASLNDAEKYAETYLRLFRSLIRRRLIASDGLMASIRLEGSDKVSKEAIKHIVDSEFEKLKSENNRRPHLYQVDTADKSVPGIALPDFLLGVLRRYIVKKPRGHSDRPERSEILFEHLRDRLVVFLDLDAGVEYSRRNPIRPWSERTFFKTDS